MNKAVPLGENSSWRCDSITDKNIARNSIHAQGYNNCTILKELKQAIGWKRHYLLPENVLFLHNNKRIHMAVQTQNSSWNLGGPFWLTPPPYLPDLAPSNFHLFLALKRALGCRWFTTDAEVQNAIEEFFKLQEQMWYYWGLEKLVYRYDKCLNKYGDYAEKWKLKYF